VQRLWRRHTARPSVIAAAVVALAGVLTTAPLASPLRSSPGTPRPSTPERARPALRPGDSIVVAGVSLTVPAPGEGVWADASTVRGDAVSVGVETRPDGTVVVHEDGGGPRPGRADVDSAAATASSGSTTATSACSDGAYTLMPYRWTRTYNWYFAAWTRPSDVGLYRTRDSLRRAATNITSSHNDCGLADLVSATHAYRGFTSRRPNITASAGCGRRDGRSVVGFGDLPSGYLAMTCWWTWGGARVEADVNLNKYEYRWYNVKPSGCRARWSVEAVATHEFGHVFGLGHVSEYYHPYLTMSPSIRPCQNSESTLGWGDVRGLRQKY
jgi:hypothetical protein